MGLDVSDVPVTPARVEVDPAAVAHLRRRISGTRAVSFPYPGRWTFGTGRDALVAILDSWRGFDVEALAAELNAIEQVDVALGAVTIRAFHLRAERRDAPAIVITHGWPSSILEVLPVARRLAYPQRYGGDPSDAFHVVVPALPGFPLSGAAADLGVYTGAGMADCWAQLMAALGYRRFAATGGDIGARVAAWLGRRHPERVIGVHVTANALRPEVAGPDAPAEEREYVDRLMRWEREDGAYMHVQETKPLSLAHALADSPAGLAAWIVEKWQAWAGGGEDVTERFAPELAGHLSLYWLTGTIATSFLPYHVAHRPPGKRPWGREVIVPVSFYLAPEDIGGIPPRAYAEHQYAIARWSELPRGGHFLATEEPELLAADVRAAFRGA